MYDVNTKVSTKQDRKIYHLLCGRSDNVTEDTVVVVQLELGFDINITLFVSNSFGLSSEI